MGMKQNNDEKHMLDGAGRRHDASARAAKDHIGAGMVAKEGALDRSPSKQGGGVSSAAKLAIRRAPPPHTQTPNQRTSVGCFV